MGCYSHPVACLAVALGLIAGPDPAAAQDGVVLNSNDAPPPPSIASDLPDNGDRGGLRKWLGAHGISYRAIYTGESFANVAGGIRRGALYEGKLETQVHVDFEKLTAWKGLSFFSNQFQIYGTGNPGRDFVGNMITISNIEALPSTRLSEIWLEQKFFDNKLGIRAGQLAVDAEFFNSRYLHAVLRPATGRPSQPENLPSGGAAYPLSTPGARLKFEPTQDLTLLVSVLNGRSRGSRPARCGDQESQRSQFPSARPGVCHRRTPIQPQQGKILLRPCHHPSVRRMASLRPIRRSAVRHR